MLNFADFQPVLLKKLVNSRRKSLIIQQGPRLFSFESICQPQSLALSVKRIDLVKRPNSAYSVQRSRNVQTPKHNNRKDNHTLIYLQSEITPLIRTSTRSEFVFEENPFQNERLKSPIRRRHIGYQRRSSQKISG